MEKSPESPQAPVEAPQSGSELAAPIEANRVSYIVERASERAFAREDEHLFPSLDPEVRDCLLDLLQDKDPVVKQMGLDWVSRFRQEEFGRRKEMTRTLMEGVIRVTEAAGGGDRGSSEAMWGSAKAELNRKNTRATGGGLRAVDN